MLRQSLNLDERSGYVDFAEGFWGTRWVDMGNHPLKAESFWGSWRVDLGNQASWRREVACRARDSFLQSGRSPRHLTLAAVGTGFGLDHRLGLRRGSPKVLHF